MTDPIEREATENPPSLNREKARRAAQHPDRPGKKCGAPASRFLPLVDRNRCEGKRDCVEVCPYGVFEVRRIDDADYRSLSFFGRLKSSLSRRCDPAGRAKLGSFCKTPDRARQVEVETDARRTNEAMLSASLARRGNH